MFGMRQIRSYQVKMSSKTKESPEPLDMSRPARFRISRQDHAATATVFGSVSETLILARSLAWPRCDPDATR
jgi:hypothetical protein